MLIESRYLTRSREDAKWGTHHCEARENGDTPSGADCRLQQIPPRRSLTLHRPPAFPFASSRLRVSPTVPKGLPCTLHALRGRGYWGGVPGTQHPKSPPDQPRWLLPCSENRNSSREVAKTRSEARENGDTPSGADCRLPANPTTPVAHLASAPSVSVRVFAASREPNSSEGPPLRALRGRGYRGGGTGDTAPGIPPDQPRWLLPCSEIRNSSREGFRSRLRVFAASREPNSPQRPPLHALRGRGYRGGTGDTAPGIPPDQPRWLLPCSEIRNSSREDAKTRSGGHTIVRREAGNTAPKAGDTPSRSRLQTASKSHHAGHSPCIGRLRFRSRLRGFA